jgi:uncharacterized protein (DUF433 family)
MGMVSVSNNEPTIIRTERGLTIAGTRITLYDVMDYLTAEDPPKFIGCLFDLTEDRINAALCYIEENRAEIEAEYQLVLREAKEIQHYWEDRNREHSARVAAMPPKPGTEALWAKLREQKAKHELEA